MRLVTELRLRLHAVERERERNRERARELLCVDGQTLFPVGVCLCVYAWVSACECEYTQVLHRKDRDDDVPASPFDS